MGRLPLEEMTAEEKIQAMESLWNDLCNRAENVQSPSWHEGVLNEREAAVARAEESIEDWENLTSLLIATPEQAGVQKVSIQSPGFHWIPAFAGMTVQ